MATLRWEKGVYDILYAFKLLTVEAPDKPVKLVFVGSGPEESRLRNLAERMGLSGRVVFTRFAYEEISAAYNLADVFILASTARPNGLEQFGYVLAEAMASGTPIITTQLGSIPEVVGDAAVLVPPSDYLALSAAMQRLLAQPQERQRLANLGRARAEVEFDSRIQADRLLEIYRSVCPAARRPTTPG